MLRDNHACLDISAQASNNGSSSRQSLNMTAPVSIFIWALMAIGSVQALAQSTTGDLDPDCVPTQSDHLGPFYVSNMPVLQDLNRYGKEGEGLVVKGLILSAAEGNSPVANARIEVWQADANGDYHPAGNGTADDYSDKELDLRGTVISGEDGRYSFRTVIPGKEGLFGRPKHFHYRITALGHRELVTQHYLSENGDQPGGKCRSMALESSDGVSLFPAPIIYLHPF